MNKLLITFLFSAIAVEVIAYLLLSGYIKQLLLPISLMANFIIIVVIFYFNRNEVYTITIDGEELHLDYFNKSFFRRKPISLRREFLKYLAGDTSKILHNDKVIAQLQRNSMKPEEWEVIQNFFLNS